MKILRRVFLVIFILIGILIIGVGGYAGYVYFQFYRIDDNKTLEVKNNQKAKLKRNEKYSISTYNIGFGAYNQDFSFFMDQGYLSDNTPVTGKESRAKSKEVVLEDTNGAINTIKSYNPDFAFFQEVDVKSHRSHKVNQYEMISNSLNDYSNIFANNFHSAYLLYPLLKPHGKVNSGITTMSKYMVTSSIRKSFTVSDKFMSKISDLDRCFMASYLPIEGSNKSLVLINLHMSAYDEGGTIRETQMKELNSFLNTEYEKGNYIIAGGDFNHDLLTNNPDFNYKDGALAFNDRFTDLTPPWLSFLYGIGNSPIDNKFKVVASDNSPSCRTADAPWQPGKTYVATIDGFIISNNIELISHKNLITKTDKLEGFAYSDHEPATMEFKLK